MRIRISAILYNAYFWSIKNHIRTYTQSFDRQRNCLKHFFPPWNVIHQILGNRPSLDSDLPQLCERNARWLGAEWPIIRNLIQYQVYMQCLRLCVCCVFAVGCNSICCWTYLSLCLTIWLPSAIGNMFHLFCPTSTQKPTHSIYIPQIWESGTSTFLEFCLDKWLKRFINYLKSSVELIILVLLCLLSKCNLARNSFRFKIEYLGYI